MLRNCLLPVNYNKPVHQTTCGEIVYHHCDELIINCKLCKIKIFDFDEFVRHFKAVHLEELEIISNNSGKQELKGETIATRDQDGDTVQDINLLDIKSENEIESRVDEIEIEEEIDFDNGGELWENGDVNERISNKDENTVDRESDQDQQLEEDEEDDVKSIMKKPRKPKEYACEICNKKYADERRLQMHVKVVHLREKNFKCPHCDQAFSENRSLQNHIGHQHMGYDCPTCHKNFSSNRNLKRHMLIHVDVKEFICSEESCGKAFASMGLLKSHQRCHSGEIFICEECGYKCRQRESLIVHKRRHTGEKPFACELCDSRFGSKPLLKEHSATHETERKHVCDVCGKSFNRPKALYHHKHLHLGIKKFVCQICGQAYAQAAGLSAHVRKHREDSGLLSSESSLCINQSPALRNVNVFYDL